LQNQTTRGGKKVLAFCMLTNIKIAFWYLSDYCQNIYYIFILGGAQFIIWLLQKFW
jgi:hypothetical protein